MDQSPAGAVRHSNEPALQRSLGMREPGQPPERSQPLGGQVEALADKLVAQARRDRAEVGAGKSGTGGKRARQALAKLVEPLPGRGEQAGGGRPSGSSVAATTGSASIASTASVAITIASVAARTVRPPP